ncbi:MAG TPA: glycosyltransferase [bacterium]|nr:glycosyltransferase [bacterium]
MTPLTVAMLSESYIPRLSGVVISLTSYAQALRADGHRVVIVAPAYPGHRDEDPDVLRLPSVRNPADPGFPVALPLRARVLRDPRVQAADVVHAHSPFVMGRLARSAARRLGRPLLFTHHTLYHEYVHYVPWLSPRLTRPAVLRYVREFANRCDLVIAPSGVIREMLRTHGVTARIEVLPTGTVDPRQTARADLRAARARYGIPADRPLLVTVSRLAPEKSVDVILRAFQQVSEPPGAYLLIVGGGPSAASLEALARELGIGERVRFTGALPHEGALEVMAGADLFVFASQTETQGLVLVEAMAAGVPVVAVGVAGAAEAVVDGESGLLVSPGPDPLAAGMRRLLADPTLRARLGRRGREIAAGYAAAALARQLVGLYHSVMIEHASEGLPQRT